MTRLLDEDGSPADVATTERDNTERKLVDEWRVKSEMLQKIVEHLPIGAVFVADNMISLNRAAEVITGYDSSELTTQDRWFVQLFGERSDEVRRDYESYRDAGFPEITQPYTIKRKDGVERLVEFVTYRFDGHEMWLMYDVTERYMTVQALHNSKERLQTILNTAADAIITINNSGDIEDVNQATEKMFGYTKNELLGHNVSMLMPSPHREKHDAYLQHYLDTGEPRIIGRPRELVAQRKNGSVFPITLSVNEVDHLGLFTGVIHDMTLRMELEKRVLESAAEEDRRIGIELHDNIQQQLTGMEYLARSLAKKIGERSSDDTCAGEIREQMEMLTQGLNKTVREVQMLARGLVPVMVDARGLHAALEGLCRQTSDRYAVECEFSGSDDVSLRDNFVATHLYRIAQEAVNNAVTHSGTASIRITLVNTNDILELRVRDEGTGMDDQTTSSSGKGLRLMEYRSGSIGAGLNIGTAQGGGTEVVCTLPLVPN